MARSKKSIYRAGTSVCATAMLWDMMSLELQRYAQKRQLAALHVGYV